MMIHVEKRRHLMKYTKGCWSATVMSKWVVGKQRVCMPY